MKAADRAEFQRAVEDQKILEGWELMQQRGMVVMREGDYDFTVPRHALSPLRDWQDRMERSIAE